MTATLLVDGEVASLRCHAKGRLGAQAQLGSASCVDPGIGVVGRAAIGEARGELVEARENLRELICNKPATPPPRQTGGSKPR